MDGVTDYSGAHAVSTNGKSWNAKKWEDMTPAGKVGCTSLGAFAVVLFCLSGNSPSSTTATTSPTPVDVAGSSYSGTTSSPPSYLSNGWSDGGAYTPTRAPETPTTSGPPPDGEVVTVTRLIDGDTFEVTGNRRIRILGIDACEASDPGGPAATAALERWLEGDPSYNTRAQITLLREPGVNRDRYDRELRYIHVNGSDIGEWLVGEYEIGVYKGRNDADPAYISALREADQYTGRQCDGSPTFNTGPDTDVDVDVDVDHHDDDDGESRFCRRRWYC